MKIMVLFGTRPEAIKMAPVILELRKRSDCELKVCFTGQHKDMVRSILDLFGISPDDSLEIMNRTLCESASEILKKLDVLFAAWRPDLLLVQGDTNSVLAAALAAFYHKIKVGHVEAGLRTHNKNLPFPEEMNRLLTTRIADLHFAPTSLARQNLLDEGIESSAIFISGNTVIDALYQTIARLNLHPELDSDFSFLDKTKKIILLTGHRRENQDGGIAAICTALKELARRDDLQIVYPVHPNPNVRDVVYRQLSGIEQIHLCDPLDYLHFVYLLKTSAIIMTDSGGVQEEAAALCKPIVLLRDVTERPEILNMTNVRITGTDSGKIISAVTGFLNEPPEAGISGDVFGSGDAAVKIADAIFKTGVP